MLQPSSAHALFRSRYPRNLEIALGIAVSAHLLAMLFFPPMEPSRVATPIEPIDPSILYEIPPEIHVLPKPPEVSPAGMAEAWKDILAVDDPMIEPPALETGKDLFERTAVPFQNPKEIFTAWDTAPQVLKSPRPAYPELAREAGAEGTVLVEVTVDRTGRVSAARLVHSDTVASLERAAVAAAMNYLFSPALQRDIPVSVKTVLTFEFRLRS